MTEEQIKAIANEYVREQVVSGNSDLINAIEDTSTMFLHWLNDKFCIIDKSKVMEAYQSNTERLNQPRIPALQEAYLKGRRMQLIDFFSVSMFNKNEE